MRKYMPNFFADDKNNPITVRTWLKSVLLSFGAVVLGIILRYLFI